MTLDTKSHILSSQTGILRLLCTSAFTDDERLRILIVGASDLNHEIVSASEDGLKRWAGKVNLEKLQVCLMSDSKLAPNAHL